MSVHGFLCIHPKYDLCCRQGLKLREKKKSLFSLMMPLEHIDFHHRLLDVKYIVIVTYFFRGNLLSSQRLLFLISSKGSLYALSHRQDSTYNSLWCTSCGPLVGTENSSNCKCTHHVGSIRHARGSKTLQQSALLPGLKLRASLINQYGCI